MSVARSEPKQLEHRTAFTLAEVLRDLDDLEESGVLKSAPIINDICFIHRLAESRLTAIPLAYADQQRIKRAEKRTPFTGNRANSRNPAFLATDLYRHNFREIWLKERRRRGKLATKRFGTFFTPAIMRQVIDEGVAWHLVNPTIEIRRCFTCWVWFESRKARKVRDYRFCTDACRQEFDDIDAKDTFHCNICRHRVSYDKYSGLSGPAWKRLSNGNWSSAYELELDQQHYHVSPRRSIYLRHVCVSCVYEKFSEWKAYIDWETYIRV